MAKVIKISGGPSKVKTKKARVTVASIRENRGKDKHNQRLIVGAVKCESAGKKDDGKSSDVERNLIQRGPQDHQNCSSSKHPT